MLLKPKNRGSYSYKTACGRQIGGVTVLFARNHTDWWRWPPAAGSWPVSNTAVPRTLKKVVSLTLASLALFRWGSLFSRWRRRKTSGDCAARWLFSLSGCWTLASWESNSQPWLESPGRLHGPIPLVRVSIAQASVILSFGKVAKLRFVFATWFAESCSHLANVNLVLDCFGAGCC